MIKSLNELEVYWWENGLCATSTLQPFVLLPHLLFAASQKERSIQHEDPSTEHSQELTLYSFLMVLVLLRNSCFLIKMTFNDKKEILNVFSFLVWCWYDVSTYIHSHPDHDKRECFIKKEVEDDHSHVPPSACRTFCTIFLCCEDHYLLHIELVWLAR